MPKKKKLTVGQEIIASAKQTLAFAKGEPDHGCMSKFRQKSM